MVEYNTTCIVITQNAKEVKRVDGYRFILAIPTKNKSTSSVSLLSLSSTSTTATLFYAYTSTVPQLIIVLLKAGPTQVPCHTIFVSLQPLSVILLVLYLYYSY